VVVLFQKRCDPAARRKTFLPTSFRAQTSCWLLTSKRPLSWPRLDHDNNRWERSKQDFQISTGAYLASTVPVL
jgi:hypothetical protein